MFMFPACERGNQFEYVVVGFEQSMEGAREARQAFWGYFLVVVWPSATHSNPAGIGHSTCCTPVHAVALQ